MRFGVLEERRGRQQVHFIIVLTCSVAVLTISSTVLTETLHATPGGHVPFWWRRQERVASTCLLKRVGSTCLLTPHHRTVTRLTSECPAVALHPYRGTSLIRNAPPPTRTGSTDHLHGARGWVLLFIETPHRQTLAPHADRHGKPYAQNDTP